MIRLLLTLALAAWIGLGAVAAEGPRVKAFVGARIIDGTGKAAIERGTIVVEDGRIQQVGASDRFGSPQAPKESTLRARLWCQALSIRTAMWARL